MRVSALYIYPVKGMRGVAVTVAQAEPRGLAGDRRWVVSDGAGTCLTQRTCPALAQINVALAPTVTDGAIRLWRDGGEAIVAEPAAEPGANARSQVTVWASTVSAADVDPSVNDWLSDALGRRAALHFMDDQADRVTKPDWTTPAPVSFADGYAFLLTTEASLAALNDAIAEAGGAPVGMARFRPNIVVGGAEPWAEDHWRRVAIGGASIDLVKPCDRCVVTTKDQSTGESMGKEPLKTLAEIRKSAHPDLNGVVLFGWNGIAAREGRIAVGDAVAVAATRPEGWPLAAPAGP